MNEVEIGGQLVPQQSFEAITQISSNRTLLVQKLTNRPGKPEPVTGLKTMNEVFDHFKPSVKVSFEKEDGTNANEELHFNNLGDFRKEGIIEQSEFLSGLNEEQENYFKIIKQLKTNKILKSAMQNPETKQAYLSALKAMMQEIENADR